MKHAAKTTTEILALVGTTALAGGGCCGPVLLQWLGLGLWMVGGRFLLVALLRYEVLLLLGVAALAVVGYRLARDRATRIGNGVLVGTALGLALLRQLWNVDRGVVMGIGPLYELFNVRQTVLAVVGVGVLALRVASLLATWRHRRAVRRCRPALSCQPKTTADAIGPARGRRHRAELRA